jgi:hypothetical protein
MTHSEENSTMNKTLPYIVIITAACLLLCAPVLVAAGEYDGTWNATVTKSSSTCKSIGKSIEGDYTAEITQGEGLTITLQVKETGTIFNGVRMKANPRIMMLEASFLREAGVVSQKMNIEMTDMNSGKGNASWSWSDGLMICGGNYEFILKRKDAKP